MNRPLHLYMLEMFTPYLFKSNRRKTSQEHPSAKERSSVLKTLKMVGTMYIPSALSYKNTLRIKHRDEIKTLFAKLESNQGSSARLSDVLTATPRMLSNFQKSQMKQRFSLNLYSGLKMVVSKCREEINTLSAVKIQSFVGL